MRPRDSAPAPGRATARRLGAAVALAAGLCALTGCGASGGVQAADRAKPAPRAQGPHRLWPERPPAPPEAGRGSEPLLSHPVAGVSVPPTKGGLRDVPPLEVLDADLAQDRADASAGRGTAPAAGSERPRAPQDPYVGDGYGDGHVHGFVRQAHYRDLTGDGSDELILGIEQPDHHLNIRAYAVREGRVHRIMNETQRVISVDLAAHDLILRSATGTPGTESRDVWSWCPDRGVMAPRLTEVLRTPREQTG
ncbi:hypothetical protein ACWGDE_04555 [Streptomyces sp. NPDC054956]